MKREEDVSPTKENTPSRQNLEDQHIKNRKQVPKTLEAEAYKLKKWRENAQKTSIRGGA